MKNGRSQDTDRHRSVWSCGLDTIEEDETQFSIGCMTSLRQLELHEELNHWSDGAVRESVRHILGVTVSESCDRRWEFVL